MRNPIFGEDVHLFRPERFTEASDDRRAEMYRTTELIFGSGRWQCAGKSLAFMELNKVFFEVRVPPLPPFPLHPSPVPRVSSSQELIPYCKAPPVL